MPQNIINPVDVADQGFGGVPATVPSGVTLAPMTVVNRRGADGIPGESSGAQVPAFGKATATTKVYASGDTGKPGTGTAAQSPAVGIVDAVAAALGSTPGGLLQPGGVPRNVANDRIASQAPVGLGLPPTYNGGSA